jgi:hypothetical protein
MNSKITKPKKLSPTFDEFKSKFFEENFNPLNDEYADWIGTSLLLHTIHNFDPSGVLSTIDQILTENKAKREQENILRALYYLYLCLDDYGNQIEELKRDYLSLQAPQLFYMYFDFSKKTFQQSKIEFFRNVWLNGLLKVDRRLGEKTAIFELVAILTEDEILTLKIMFNEQQLPGFQERKFVDIEKIAQTLNIEREYSQHICVSLQSRGLLYDYGIGFFDYPGPVHFVLTDFSRLLIEYITEPDLR